LPTLTRLSRSIHQPGVGIATADAGGRGGDFRVVRHTLRTGGDQVVEAVLEVDVSEALCRDVSRLGALAFGACEACGNAGESFEMPTS
jgi:hypothetical protein